MTGNSQPDGSLPVPPGQDVFIGRQPILDRSEQLYAYELLFRSGHQNHATFDNDDVATASVISHTFSDLGIEAALGPYKGFLNVGKEMLMHDALQFLPHDKIVLELLETVPITPAVVERCRELHEAGFELALDDVVGIDEQQRAVLESIAVVKVDIKGMDERVLRNITAELKGYPKLKLLAEKVDSREQADRCRELGYDFFQGYYFARPAVIVGKKLSHSEVALLRLLGLLAKESDTPELEAVFKQEPGLTLNLIRLTNSVAGGGRARIRSLRDAITVLGRRQLMRWLQILMFTSPSAKGSLASPLLQLAATRGRFMELLAGDMEAGDKALEDAAFMTGIISLMPALLGLQMEAILAELNVSQDAAEALLRRSGRLGALLRLAESLEQAELDLSAELLQFLPGITPLQVAASQTRALAWANSIGQETAG
jgi:c-di-GMP-related signal transduction protein